MNKKYFALKLVPSRPDFAQTMTDEERGIMQQHIMYWRDYLQKGVMHVFGPVLDPKGTYGFGIISAESEEEVKDLTSKDPAAGINTYEYYPMMAVFGEK